MIRLPNYEEFILKNAHQVATVESSLRSLTYILPGRFNDAELASEFLFATLNLLGLYHDSIMLRAIRSEKSSDTLGSTFSASVPNATRAHEQPNLFNRYTRRILNSSSMYKRLALALTLLQATQVLLEMAAKRKWGDRGRWRAVLGLECLKSVIRLILYRLSNQRMLLHAVWPERDIDPNTITVDTASTTYSSQRTTWKGQRTGMSRTHISSLTSQPKQNPPGHSPSSSEVTSYIVTKVLTPETARKAQDLISSTTPGSLRSLAEIFFILRPLFFVLGIRRYGTSSWRPWFLSLVVEMMSRSLNSWGLGRKGQDGLSKLEKEEIQRRKWLVLYYLLRSPFYEKFTRKRLNDFCDKASQRGLLSLFAGVIRDYQPLWEGIYFYTSAS